MTPADESFARAIAGQVWQTWGAAFRWSPDVWDDLEQEAMLAAVIAIQRTDRDVSPGRSYFYRTVWGRLMNWCKRERNRQAPLCSLAAAANHADPVDWFGDAMPEAVHYMSHRGQRIVMALAAGYRARQLEGVDTREVELIMVVLAQ